MSVHLPATVVPTHVLTLRDLTPVSVERAMLYTAMADGVQSAAVGGLLGQLGPSVHQAGPRATHN